MKDGDFWRTEEFPEGINEVCSRTDTTATGHLSTAENYVYIESICNPSAFEQPFVLHLALSVLNSA